MTVTLPIKAASAALTIEAMVVAHGTTRVVHGLDIQARAGEIVTLLGPSGCGKTTTLRAIAGLETPLEGRIAIAGRTVFDAAAGIDLPPERRGLSMVFQSYAIWPHMTVFENVAFGLRARGAKRAEIADAVRRSLESVGLADLAARPATLLSGGQQQRVALARSIACNPAVILLDEPLSNLDAQLRLAMRTEFKTLQRHLGLTAIYVTHDQEEALVLSDRIVVMRDGMVEQSGAPAEIHDAPASRFVADFMGVRNLLPCRIARDGGRLLALLAGAVRLAVRGVAPEGPACIGFRPSAVLLSPYPAPGTFAATLANTTYLGDTMQYELAAGPLVIHARTQPRFDLAEGAAVYWSVPPEACFLVPA
jgi:iron(III) transport system ATP-binding protein